MEIEQEFEAAIKKADQLTQRPSNEDLLKLYSFYKQGTEGDIQGERPGGFDFKAIAKYDAWASLKGTTKDDAKRAYIHLIDTLHANEAS